MLAISSIAPTEEVIIFALTFKLVLPHVIPILRLLLVLQISKQLLNYLLVVNAFISESDLVIFAILEILVFCVATIASTAPSFRITLAIEELLHALGTIWLVLNVSWRIPSS